MDPSTAGVARRGRRAAYLRHAQASMDRADVRRTPRRRDGGRRAAAAPARCDPPPAGPGRGRPGKATVTLVTGDRVTVTRPVTAGRRRRSSRPDGRAGGSTSTRRTSTAPCGSCPATSPAWCRTRSTRSSSTSPGSSARAMTTRPPVRPAADRARARRGAAGLCPLAAGRRLPSIGATATSLPKARAAELGARPGRNGHRAIRWPAGHGSGSMPKSTVEQLDPNLTQIGAPAAWNAGLSGAGVTVAVLDTGVDDAHPDLAGRVAGEANFTDSPVADDRNGHGTHVASLVAGSGAAAGGARRGVAFGATAAVRQGARRRRHRPVLLDHRGHGVGGRPGRAGGQPEPRLGRAEHRPRPAQPGGQRAHRVGRRRCSWPAPATPGRGPPRSARRAPPTRR